MDTAPPTALDPFRPVIMWFWNATPREDEIRRQIAAFQQQRIMQFFIHPAYGLEIPYLSEEYFRAYAIALDEAKRRGMRVWIYDEYAWPSGPAGGKVLSEHPECRMVNLMYGRYDVERGATVALAALGVPFLVRLLYWKHKGNGHLARIETLDVMPEQWTNTSDCPASLLVFSEAVAGGVHPACRWSAFSTNQHGSLDGCSPEAVRRFIDCTHEQYYRRFKEEFGGTIVGSFIDEPVLSTGWILQTAPHYVGLPWHRGLPEAFRKEAGFDLIARMHELAFPVGDYRSTRCAFWRYLSKRFGNAFLRQVGAWCREHRIALTGHVNAEESILATLLTTGDWHEAVQWFYVPGIDNVMSRQQLGSEALVLPAKQAASLASQHGRERVFCETYTGSGWNTTPLDMKRVFDRLAVLGINMLQFMGAYYSIKGFRKLPPDASWPPSHLFQNALWPHYGLFSDYTGRVCRLLAEGRHAADVAILYPITSAWAAFAFGHEAHCAQSPDYERDWRRLLSTYQGIACSLLAIQTDYEILFEDPLVGGRIEDGRLRIGNSAFRTILLPACETIGVEALNQLERFAQAGGHVVFVNAAPAHAAEGGGIDGRVADRWGIAPGEVNARARALFGGADKHSEYLAGAHSNVSVLLTNCLEPGERTRLYATLREAVRPAMGVVLEPPSPDIWVQTREVAAGLRLCLVNTSDRPYAGRASVPFSGAASELDAESGAWFALPSKADAGNTVLSFELDAYGLQIIDIGSGSVSEQRKRPPSGARHAMTLDSPWRVEPLGDNILPLTMGVFTEANGPIPLEEAATLAPERFMPSPDGRFIEGVEPHVGEGNGWGVMEGAYPVTGFDRGRTYWTRASFEVGEIPRAVRFVTEDLGLSLVALNGHVLNLMPCREWDESNLAAPVARFLRQGANVVLMRLTIPEWDGPHALPMTALCGSFELDARRRIVRAQPLHRLGDWSRDGYPYYAGSMRYTQHFLLPDLGKRAVWVVVERAADAVEMHINGRQAGVRLWTPYLFEVGDLVQAGANTLTANVTNTSANRYGSKSSDSDACTTGTVVDQRTYEPVPSGLFGPVRVVF